MKVSKLTNSLLVFLLSAAPVIVVAADSKYPATDFQPKVVYQDSDYKHSKSSAASSSKSSPKVSTTDSNYPAANFQPEVLYQDKGYKHTKDKVSSSSYSSGSSPTQEVAEQSASVESDESSFSLMLGLLIVAVAGFIFYKRGNNTAKPARRRAPVRQAANGDSGGLSGVAKYLETKAGPLVSGVAKYLQEHESVAISGVAKYVAKQKVTERNTETKSVSGVDKYLKDRG